MTNLSKTTQEIINSFEKNGKTATMREFFKASFVSMQKFLEECKSRGIEVKIKKAKVGRKKINYFD